jgi:hypothetical protein
MLSKPLSMCKFKQHSLPPKSLTIPSRHQKKALTFMTKREEGWQHDGSNEDLWVKEVDETGQMT